jgi:hypothetical protein
VCPLNDWDRLHLVLRIQQAGNRQPVIFTGQACRSLRCSALSCGPVGLDDAELTVRVTGDLIRARVALDTPAVITGGLHLQHVIAGVVGAADGCRHFPVAHLGGECRLNKGKCSRECQTDSLQVGYAGPPGVGCFQEHIVSVLPHKMS